jgi:hypothetical protein
MLNGKLLWNQKKSLGVRFDSYRDTALYEVPIEYDGEINDIVVNAIENAVYSKYAKLNNARKLDCDSMGLEKVDPNRRVAIIYKSYVIAD